MKKLTVKVLSILTSAFVLGGCAQTTQANPSIDSETFTSSLEQLITRPGVDFQATSSPELLAASAEHVFTGTVIEAIGTRKWVSKTLNVPVRQTTILKVKIQEVFSGAENIGDEVFVEVLFKPAKDLGELSDLLRETEVGVFATNARLDTQADRIEPDFELSPNAQLFSALGPQGFVLEVPSGNKIMWPVLMDIETGSLPDAMPGGTLIPSE